MGFRLIRRSFDVDLDRVWDTVTDDLPPLVAWTLLQTGRPFAAAAPSHPLERTDGADQPSSPVPAPVTTRPAGP
jgi:hypothetical protein